ncbi:MAG TPA: NAD+ synthase [Candidatus Nitrosocosmicus sp.]|nr:NAD+ synthase [Candidatus Nitrosocosmicus sp.]
MEYFEDSSTFMDYGQVTKTILNFIKKEIESRKSDGVVIGVSGGIDSAVLAYLAVRALGNNKVLGLLLPDKDVTPLNDITDGLEVCKRLGIEYKKADIKSPKQGFNDILDQTDNRIVEGNLVARIRMCIMYYYACMKGRLVLGSSNKTELFLGYFTKYGDGAADLLPLGDLYKTEIIKLAKHLEIPRAILDKKSSARLWTDQITEEELGLPFNQLDPIVYKLIGSQNKKYNEILDYENDFPAINVQSIQRIQKLIDSNKHKLSFPPVCVLPRASTHEF